MGRAESRQRGPLLEARDVTLRFGGVTALQDVTFDVNDNELFAIIGPNGAGKTSIFNCLNGVYHPQEGTIRFEGTNLVGMRPSAIANWASRATFQNLGLFVNLNAIDNLMLGRHHLMKLRGSWPAQSWSARRAGGKRSSNRKRVEEIIELLELGAVPDAARRLAAVRRAEAHRARSGARDGPDAAAARRAGRRDEPRGDRGHGALHPRRSATNCASR